MNHQEFFSTMECNWTIEKNPPPEKYYKIISVVFFLKESSYKNPEIYLNGLKYIIKNFKKFFFDFRLRIYHDNTTHQLIKNLIPARLKDSIELYQYDIPLFREKNKTFHKGTIGTLIRFLPFYNFELHQVEETIVIDIDNKIYSALYQIYRTVRKNEIKLAYRFRYCYGFKKRLLCLEDDNLIEFPIIASTIFNLITCPKEIFLNFIDELYIKNNKKMIDFVKKCDLTDKYEYGIDEIFINNYHLKYFYQQKLTISPIVFTDNTTVNALRTLIKNLGEKDIPEFNLFLTDIFKLLNFNFPNKKFTKQELQNYLYQNKDTITPYAKQKFQSKELINFLKTKLNNLKIKNNIDYYWFLTLKCLINSFEFVHPSKINLVKLETDFDKKTNKTLVKNIKSYALIDL